MSLVDDSLAHLGADERNACEFDELLQHITGAFSICASADEKQWVASILDHLNGLSDRLLVGGETTGISEALLESMDDVARIPTPGFIPSYNVQAAVGMLLGEWLRQNQV